MSLKPLQDSLADIFNFWEVKTAESIQLLLGDLMVKVDQSITVTCHLPQ
jgi:hypothetical protein